MNIETLKRANEIKYNLERLLHINSVLKDNRIISNQRVSLNFMEEISRDNYCIMHECFTIDIEDFLSKEDLSEKVNHRILELQKELDSL